MASNITSVSKREKVISLWSSGYRNKEICSRLHLSHQTVSNILSKFLQNGTAAPGKPGWKERTVATANVVEFVEYCKVAPWVDIVIGAFHALLEVSRHRSLFFRAKLSSNGSAVVPTAMLSDRGHTHASRISISLSLLDIYKMDIRRGLDYRRFFRIHKCFRVILGHSESQAFTHIR